MPDRHPAWSRCRPDSWTCVFPARWWADLTAPGPGRTRAPMSGHGPALSRLRTLPDQWLGIAAVMAMPRSARRGVRGQDVADTLGGGAHVLERDQVEERNERLGQRGCDDQTAGLALQPTPLDIVVDAAAHGFARDTAGLADRECIAGAQATRWPAFERGSGLSGKAVTRELMPNVVMGNLAEDCLLYTSPSPRDISGSRMPSSA